MINVVQKKIPPSILYFHVLDQFDLHLILKIQIINYKTLLMKWNMIIHTKRHKNLTEALTNKLCMIDNKVHTINHNDFAESQR